MRESIVCIGRTGSKPYRFSETGVCISSYEELCYYLRGHMLCYLYTLPEEELLTYLRDELGLYKLYHQLIKFTDPVRDQMKYFSTLFREGNYFSEEEIHQILDEYRYLKNLPYALQCKMTGDMYLQAGRAAMAIYYYKEALKGEVLTAAETGAVYHNRGIARARLFRIREAEKDFVHAYRYSGEEESLFYYYCLIALTENLEKAEKELETFKVSDLMRESFENRFAGIHDEYRYTAEAAREEKISYLKEHEKEEEAKAMYARFMAGLRKRFRPELEMEDRLSNTSLPVGGETRSSSPDAS